MNEHLIKNEAATFIAKVASLSMRDAGIDIDDELVVDRSLEANIYFDKISWIKAFNECS